MLYIKKWWFTTFELGVGHLQFDDNGQGESQVFKPFCLFLLSVIYSGVDKSIDNPGVRSQHGTEGGRQIEKCKTKALYSHFTSLVLYVFWIINFQYYMYWQ